MYLKNTPHIVLGIALFLLGAGYASASNFSPTSAASTSSLQDTGPCGRSYDKVVSHPYMIHATWMFNRGNACEWQTTLEQFHRIGGKVVIQFGQALQKLQRIDGDLYEFGTKNLVYGACQEDGNSCVTQALQDFQREGLDSSRIVNWLAYTSDAQYTDAIVCKTLPLDKKIELRVKGEKMVFWRIVLPRNKNQNSCDYTTGKFDVLFVKSYPEKLNEARSLMQVADALNMDVYLGAPAFTPLQERGWIVDKDLINATMGWSRRVFLNYAEQYKQHRSFKGIYQTFEVALQPGWEGNEHKVYQQQVSLFHKTNPGKKYMISPYIMVNKDMYGSSLAGTVKGFKLLARTGIDIIIPQDGRGTGKGALYWPWQKNLPIKQVDEQLANFSNVKINATFAKQYHASSIELFRALKRAKQELKQKEGVDVDLWANVEAFDEDKRDVSYTGCAYSDLSQTKKSRLDRAITFAAGTTRKVASFMYDPLFLCKDRYGISLLDQIKSDFDRPVITHVALSNSQRSTLTLKGHYISKPGLHFNIKWKDQNGKNHQNVVKAETENKPNNDSVTLKLVKFSPAINSYIQVDTISQDGRRSHEVYSMKIPGLLARN